MAVSKRLRYEVFRRDDFTCRYCGAKAPDAQLRPDHVVPVALGGSDDPSNLVTSCDACNSGKTSTTPDAPLVADVSADALRWARAMREAADRMRADHAARQNAYGQFEEWWGNWNHGFYKKPLPKPDDWRNSIDSFTAAGLPLDVLKWCVDKAGASKAAPDQTWRYMCGIAWKKVTELQQAARSITGESGRRGQDDGPRTPDQYAGHLLERMNDKERARAFRREDITRDDPDEPATTDEGRAAGALWFAFDDLLMDRRSSESLLAEMLRMWPDERGATALTRAREDLERRFGPDFDEHSALINAAWEAVQELQAARAEEYLAALPDGQREAWLQRARDRWSERDFGFDDWFYITEAADLAREAMAEAAR